MKEAELTGETQLLICLLVDLSSELDASITEVPCFVLCITCKQRHLAWGLGFPHLLLE